MARREDEFEIWQTDAGYVAVTNAVRRRILEALLEGEKELGDLVEVTGKSKPTLSNIHVRELITQNLVEERPHPTDARRKLFSVRGRRIGSSNIPIDQLRGAVKHYVTLSPLAFTLPLRAVVDALLAAAGDAKTRTLMKQGAAIGEAAAHIFTTTGPRDALTALAGFLEREDVMRAGKMDLDALVLEGHLPDALAGTQTQRQAAADALAGFMTGVVASRLGLEGEVSARVVDERRVAFQFPRA